MKTTVDLFWHSIFIGIVSAIVVIICGLLGLKTWIAFFAWANYFLHGCQFKKSLKMLMAFIIGVLFAFVASQLINYYSHSIADEYILYISSGVTFIVGTCLIHLERFKNWGEMVPATFLGTVLYYSSGVTGKNIIPELLFPILIGILAGIVSI